MSQPHVPQVTNHPLTTSALPAAIMRATRLKCGTYEVQTSREEIAALPRERQAWIKKRIALRARDKRARHNLSVRGARRAVRARGRLRRNSRAGASARSAAGSVDGDPGGGDDGPGPAKSKGEQTVIVVPTRNRKLAAPGELVFASTLPVQQTCPQTCPLLDNGCYAQRGPGGHVARLERNAATQGLDALDLAREEARLISRAARKLRKRLKGCEGPPLRLHVTGDAATPEAVRILVEACREWPGPVWTYTHAWREVPREAWESVSVLASVETAEEVRSAVARGYAPAMTVPTFSEGGRPWSEGGIRFIPCPAELYANEERQRRAEIEAGGSPVKRKKRPQTCFECGLCFDADALLERGMGIAFEAHGSGKLIAAKALVRARAAAEGGKSGDSGGRGVST